MIKPILNQVKAFSSLKSHTFTFQYSGTQAVKNRLVIRDNETNTVVFDNEQETMQLKHDVPAETLTNGIAYNAVICAADISGIYSPYSDPILFYCYSDPVFVFTNLAPDQIIRNSSYDLLLSYTQVEGELLNNYQVVLYNAQKTAIRSGAIKYDNFLTETISNLEDKELYYVKAFGSTVNGMDIETAMIPFRISYDFPVSYSNVELENLYNEGIIRVTCNLVSITGESNHVPIYKDNTMIDLTSEGNYVVFNKGFKITNDFYLEMKFNNANCYKTILELKNENLTLSFTYMQGDFTDIGEKTYVLLTAFDGTSKYVLTSEYLDPPSQQELLVLTCYRIDNLYQIHFKKEV